MEDPGFYIPFDKDKFNDDNCFLCGINPSEARSKEHIFPKWLQKKYNLSDERLTLLNNTKIQYKKLTVACCKTCNNEHLSALEKKFQSLLNNSFKDLRFEDELIIFQWTAKILYSTLYKELTLTIDRSKPELGKILEPKMIEGYSALHLFLQSIRIPTKIEDPKPWSIFVFKCKDDDYHYMNTIKDLAVAFKFGEVGLCITFEDNNLISSFLEKIRLLSDYPLSFSQFLEVITNIFYAAKIKENAPRYMTVYKNKNNSLIINTLGSIRLREWNQEEFGDLLDFSLLRYGMFDGNKTYQSKDNLLTYLVDESGVPLIEKLKGKSNKLNERQN